MSLACHYDVRRNRTPVIGHIYNSCSEVIIMMQVFWDCVMAVGLSIVVFACSFLGLERDNRVNANVVLLAIHLCCAF